MNPTIKRLFQNNRIVRDWLRPFYRNSRHVILVSHQTHIIRRKKKRGAPLKILFLVQYPEMWDALRTVYENAVQSGIETIILAIPKKKDEPAPRPGFELRNAAFSFLKERYPCVKDAFSGGKWIRIANLRPDYIFVQRPFDDLMPSCYKMRKLERHGLICHISYGYHFTEGFHLNVGFNLSLIHSVHMLFAENERVKEYVEDRMESLGLKNRIVINSGSPKYDERIPDFSNPNRVTALWTPRWSLTQGDDQSHFFDYYEFLMAYYDMHPEQSLFIRPHPLMFDCFVKEGRMSREEVQKIKEAVDMKDNVSWDKDADYWESVSRSSFMIADFTSMVIPYFLTGKPIVSSHVYDNIMNELKPMTDSFYYVNDSKSLFRMIDDISRGIDPLYDKRHQVAERLFPEDWQAGRVIINSIMAYEKNS